LFNRLDRYILRQLWAPFLLGMSAFVFLMSMRALFELGELVIRKGAPLGLVAGMLLVQMPRILVLVLPIATLLAVLVVFGRMAADSELTALKSAGVTLWRQSRAPLVFGLLMTGIGLYMTHQVVPSSAQSAKTLTDKLITESDLFRLIQPRVIFDQIPGLTLYVEKINPQERKLEGLFVNTEAVDGASKLSLAQSGTIAIDKASGRVSLSLVNGHTYEFPPGNPMALRETGFEVQELGGQLPPSSLWSQRAIETGTVWQLTDEALSELLRNPAGAPVEVRRTARLERLNRNTIPLAALVLALFAIPLSLASARGGRGAALGVALLIFVAYGILHSMLANLCRVGHLSPWVAALLAPVLFSALGMIQFARRSRRDDPGEWNQLWRLGQWLKRLGVKTLDAAPALKVGASRRGPKILDRYLAVSVMKYIAYTLVAVVMISVLVELRGIADDAVKNHIPAHEVAWTLLLSVPEQVIIMLPYAVLLGVLVGFSVLSHNNELTVLRAAGISIRRQGLPVLVCAGGIMLAMFAAGEWVVPPAARAHWRMKEKVQARTFISGRLEDKNWLFGGDPGIIYHYSLLASDQRPEGQALAGFSFYRVDFSRGLLAERLTAELIELNGAELKMRGGIRRLRNGEGWQVERLADGQIQLPDPADHFKPQLRLDYTAMSTRELNAYLKRLSVKKLPGTENVRVDIHSKFSDPASSFVLAVIALAFAFRSGRSGSLFGIGIGLALGILFAIANILLNQVGKVGLEPPFLAAWGADIIALIGGLYLYLGEPS
jgi:LPS export ABC transporter permease LptF/LPS export ABC transporter permease LptG